MATFENGNLVLEEGETVEFPVGAGNPLSECQEMRRIGSLEDVKDFQFVQEWSAGLSPDAIIGTTYFYPLSRPSADEFLRLIRERSGGTLVTLQLDDFIIPAGSTVVLNGSLVEVNANTVVIAGQLKFTDDLIIRCNEIRGS
jgi:hypothetical protein